MNQITTRSIASHRLPGLDALRGLAIALVLLGHGLQRWIWGPSIVGVVVFFTLSGYLITGILASELRRTGKVSLGRFYRNRALRLMPALMLLVLVFTTVEATASPLRDRSGIGKSAGIALVYLADLPFAHDVLSPGLHHLWTLAIEEQFYLLWPFVLVLALRRNLVLATLMGVGATIASMFAASVVHHSQSSAEYVYVLPTSWAITLLLGAAAQLYRETITRMLRGPILRISAALAVSVLVALTTTLSVWMRKPQLSLYLIGAPVIALCTIVLIAYLTRWDELPNRALRAAVGLGRVSYAAYLWNWPIVLWLTHGRGRPTLLVGLLSIPLTIVAAALSWWCVEQRVARLKARLDAHREERAVFRSKTVPAPSGPGSPAQ